VAKCCESGFHACEYPLDIFSYYGPVDNRFSEVEISGNICKGDDDSKIAGTEIEIKSEINIPMLIKASVDFLKQNQTKAGIKTTASGLQYEVISEGSGAKPTATSQVTVHYKGTLLNGFEFDSSYKRGQPIDFPLNRVIACWTEGVQRMKVGGKAKLTCPPEIAYGSRGAGSAVPPNATLLFEVELLGIQGR
jgi:FKBP-type peptidyl-prolyl cis-trans isomerase FkpA